MGFLWSSTKPNDGSNLSATDLYNRDLARMSQFEKCESKAESWDSVRSPAKSAGESADNLGSAANSTPPTQDIDGGMTAAQRAMRFPITELHGNKGFEGLAGIDNLVRTTKPVLYSINSNLSGLRPQCDVILIFGPPGTGKTEFSNAIAAEFAQAQAKENSEKPAIGRIMKVGGKELLSRWTGDAEKNVAAMFQASLEVQEPHVLFLDELDSLTPIRGKSDLSTDTDAVTNTFLIHLQDYINHKSTSGTARQRLVVACTNRPEAIETGMLRRIDTKVYLGAPDAAGRESILRQRLGEYEKKYPGALSLSNQDYTDLASDRVSGLHTGASLTMAVSHIAGRKLAEEVLSANYFKKIIKEEEYYQVCLADEGGDKITYMELRRKLGPEVRILYRPIEKDDVEDMIKRNPTVITADTVAHYCKLASQFT